MPDPTMPPSLPVAIPPSTYPPSGDVVTDPNAVADRVFGDLAAEVVRQDSLHAGYTPTRDSLRLALATVQDEVQEALDAWRADRCKCGVPQCSCSTWSRLREEALQAAAIIVRVIRAIDGCGICDSPDADLDHRCTDAPHEHVWCRASGDGEDTVMGCVCGATEAAWS